MAYAKANKEKVTFASSGMGSATHLCAMLFQEAIGTPVTMVQYKGAAPAMLDMRAGQVDLLCDLPTTTSGAIRSGDLRAFVLTAPKRMASLADVPTADEVGMPSLHMSTWFGLYAPLGTPKPVLETLNKALREVVADKAVAEQLEKIETVPSRSTRRRPRRIAPCSPRRSPCGGRSSRRRASRRSSMTTRTSMRDNGEAMRRRLFGDDDGRPLMRTLNSEAVYGAIWSRPGLASRTAWSVRSPRSPPCSA